MKDELNARQKKFVEHYLATNNATEAAKNAGYSPNTAKQMGTENLSKPAIRRAIEKRTKTVLAGLSINTDMVLRELANLAFSSLRHYLDIDEYGRARPNIGKATPDQMAAIKSLNIVELRPMIVIENGQEIQFRVIKTEIALWNKLQALVALAEYMGLIGPACVNNSQNKAPVVDTASQIEAVKRLASMLSRPKNQEMDKPDNSDYTAD